MTIQIGDLYPVGMIFTTDDGRMYIADGSYRREKDETPMGTKD